MDESSGDTAQATDLELARRWGQGDTEAGGELFDRYFDQIRGYFINAGNEKDHRDLAQATFTELTASIGGFRGDSSFRTYLFSIARIVRINYYRKNYRLKKYITDADAASVEDYEGMTPSDAVSRLEDGSRLNACVRALPIDDREIIELHYWHGWMLKEIAELFGAKETTIRSRLHRAKAQLRTGFDQQLMQLSRTEAVDDLERELELVGRELGIPGGHSRQNRRRRE